jgi:hypothetical protein
VTIEPISLFAEIALGLAGFAGVAVVIGRGPGRWGGGDSLRIRLLLGAAFTALFASLVATGAHWTGVGEAEAIRLGAGALLAGQLYWIAFPARQIRHLEPSERALFDPRLAIVFRAIAFSNCVAQGVLVTGLAVGRLAPWLFLYGLFGCLGYAALGFVRFMFIRPASE